MQTVVCTWSRREGKPDFEAPAWTPAHPHSGIYRHIVNPDTGRTLCGHRIRTDANWRLDQADSLTVHCQPCLQAYRRPIPRREPSRPVSSRQIIPDASSGFERRLNKIMEKRSGRTKPGR